MCDRSKEFGLFVITKHTPFSSPRLNFKYLQTIYYITRCHLNRQVYKKQKIVRTKKNYLTMFFDEAALL